MFSTNDGHEAVCSSLSKIANTVTGLAVYLLPTGVKRDSKTIPAHKTKTTNPINVLLQRRHSDAPKEAGLNATRLPYSDHNLLDQKAQRNTAGPLSTFFQIWFCARQSQRSRKRSSTDGSI